MTRNTFESFYKSKTWQRVQADYMKTQDHLCERCKAKGLFVPAKIVHHKEHLNFENVYDWSKAYSFDNLEALCLDCHNKEHFSRKKRYEITTNGELFIRRDEE